MTRLAATSWCDGPALVALLRIGTPDAFAAMEQAMGEAGDRARAFDRTTDEAHVRNSDGPGKKHTTRTNAWHSSLEELRVYGLQHTAPSEVVPFLVKLLWHPNFDVRVTAIQSLSRLGAVAAAPDIVRSAELATNEFGTSYVISNALGEFGARLDAEPFLTLLEVSNTPETVQRFCVEALGSSRDPAAFPVLRQLVLDRRHLFHAVQALGRLGHRGGAAVLTPLLTARDMSARDRYLVTIELGRLGHRVAFEPIARAARRRRGPVGISTIAALAATGGDTAIPLLRQLWGRNPDNRRPVLEALIWISSAPSIDTVLDLLMPHDAAAVELLVKALDQGAVRWVGAHSRVPIDDRLVALIVSYYDQLPLDVQRATLWAFENGRTLAGLRLIERIVSGGQCDSVALATAPSNAVQTLREYACDAASRAGSAVAIDYVVDKMAAGTSTDYTALELGRVNRGAVVAAVQQRLSRLSVGARGPRAQLLQLLGWFGDAAVLSDVRRFVDHPDQVIADRAYEAEQQLLGVADIE